MRDTNTAKPYRVVLSLQVNHTQAEKSPYPVHDDLVRSTAPFCCFRVANTPTFYDFLSIAGGLSGFVNKIRQGLRPRGLGLKGLSLTSL